MFVPVCICKCAWWSSLKSRGWGTGPCWQLCCEGLWADPQPLCFLWAPADCSALELASAHTVSNLLWGNCEPDNILRFHYNTDFSKVQMINLPHVETAASTESFNVTICCELTSVRHLWSSGWDPSLHIFCKHPRLVDLPGQWLWKQIPFYPPFVFAFPSQCTPLSTHCRECRHKWRHWTVMGKSRAPSVWRKTGSC